MSPLETELIFGNPMFTSMFVSGRAPAHTWQGSHRMRSEPGCWRPSWYKWRVRFKVGKQFRVRVSTGKRLRLCIIIIIIIIIITTSISSTTTLYITLSGQHTRDVWHFLAWPRAKLVRASTLLPRNLQALIAIVNGTTLLSRMNMITLPGSPWN